MHNHHGANGDHADSEHPDQPDTDPHHRHHGAHAREHGHTHEHAHAHHHDHDHEHFPQDEAGPAEDNPLWQRDNVTLWSVGIDIGSAGTQILFSRVQLQRQAVELSSRYIIVSRETLYESPVSLTPYESETLIDGRALGQIVDEAYRIANVLPSDIDTGVVILTGEALRRENAARIARILSEKCGDLVCATAGHHMEARLAAFGSGAARASFDRKECILNIDIGGGTTKLSVLEGGKLLSTAAIHVGGRLLAIDNDLKLTRLDPAGQTHALRAGYSWHAGDQVQSTELDKVADTMADTLIAALTQSPISAEAAAFYLTEPIPGHLLRRATSMMFSGGVAEFVYQREERDFGDLGGRLGQTLRQRIDSGLLPWTLLRDSQGIRSTALGASEYTTQLSGNTCYVTDHAQLLPQRNIQVLRPEFIFTDEFEAEELASSIRQHLTAFEVSMDSSELVLAFHWQGTPEYSRIKALAEGIQRGASERLARGKALFVVLDDDIALNLGATLREDLHIDNPLLVIDGVSLSDFDYIDIGKVRHPSNTMPVTIKSLIFNDTLISKRAHTQAI
ncbi:ethanolamine ammonia-lyase reactivating factor EutA [Pseudomonas agarici]|uniref:ethanolamine ammonia-lyase reactivating factor EutA n=1 Tax=Pseudomonas agarici TaxID=46677 RepID=UPI0002E4DFE2|nr:ethanolamine ammonia-lyase reactivating factor EutA [Pseudomonas agarici]NWB91433.1 ethanolamine ammonia-lyase reactivating factor EutA [Pseudomonas agarici]NWC07819.1 ethanolamine ammonia-lyase reactivating factor EutA [Pseudomonas agarici]SEK75314.1 ethanolamine utilization protein EutA [Pseudomonas agarici]